QHHLPFGPDGRAERTSAQKPEECGPDPADAAHDQREPTSPQPAARLSAARREQADCEPADTRPSRSATDGTHGLSSQPGLRSAFACGRSSALPIHPRHDARPAGSCSVVGRRRSSSFYGCQISPSVGCLCVRYPTRWYAMSTHAHSFRGVESRPAVHIPGSMSVRLAAPGGASFCALFLLFAVLTSGTPTATSSRQDVFNYLSGHHGRLQVAATLLGLAMLAALLLVSGLFRALRKAEGGTAAFAVAALGGGVLAAASTVAGALIMGTTAVRIADIGPASARLWWTMYLLSIDASLFGLLLLIGATAILSLESRLFPRWFALASVDLALVSIVGAFTMGYATTGIQATAGIAVILDSVWILLVSFFLWRDPKMALPTA